MLQLVLGRAGSGKTGRIMEEIRLGVKQRRGGLVLLVPEQYSHEAERELCAVCGDALSLYGEVMSFTGLASRVETELGARGKPLDKGGRLLAMTLALGAVSPRLRVYGAAQRRPELRKNLLSAVTELKAACISAPELEEASARCTGALRDKLWDMSVVMEAYDAVVSAGHADPADRLDALRENIGRSAAAVGHVYIDGFTDFTAQELGVIGELIKRGTHITVCLTCEDLKEGAEPFELSRRTALRLLAMAKDAGMKTDIKTMEPSEARSGAMQVIEKHLLGYTPELFEDAEGAVSLFCAPSVFAECELAAGRVLELVRERGCRFKDIAIAVRGFEEYGPVLESVFEYYGVPLFLTRRSDMLQKPVPALIASAFEIISGGWDTDAVLGYMKTGLVGLERTESDLLENYALTWSLRASAWTKKEELRLHPDGYGAGFDESTEARLNEINALRRRLAQPVLRLQNRGKEASTAREQAIALSDFLQDISLPERLSVRARELREAGRSEAAGEYAQLWQIVKNALEQCALILGDAPMEQEEFGSLFALVLSQYDVGTIPVSLDMVSAGDFDRMRRRHIKHMLVLGASDERLPQIKEGGGVFSPEDREQMGEQGLEIGGLAVDELSRELGLIYNCLTLPSETLYVSYCVQSAEGAQARPSFVLGRLGLLFGKTPGFADVLTAKSHSRGPALELAAGALKSGQGPLGAAAREYFKNEEGGEQRLELLRAAAEHSRGSLSSRSVRSLYGERLHLSASRAEAFASCKFKYFLQYGLRARPRKKAGFDPPEMGSFMHFVLEQVAGEVMDSGGFGAVDAGQVEAMTDKYIARYVHETLDDFREKSSRFIYLFRRLTKTVRRVVSDMAEELRRSEFVPLDFELDFSGAGELPALELGGGEDKLYLTGVADRVDGWVHEGKLYIRVVDYKTGKKAFDLSDVWYGMGLQMLLYLFTLAKTGGGRYGREIVPAGVLYVPARDVLTKSRGRISEEEAEKSRAKELKRSGLVLDDPEVIEAMERGDAPRYIPVSFNKEGTATGDSLATYERLGRLSRHIDDTLVRLARELRGGSIDADPYFRNQLDAACTYCDYFDACHFDEGRDLRRYLTKLKPGEVWEKLEGGAQNG